MSIKFKKLTTCLATVALAGFVTTGVVGAQNDRTESDPAAMPKVNSVDRQLAEQFGILRRSQHDGDALPGKPAGPFGANLDLARSVETPAGKVWVVPAHEHVCLRVQDTVGSAWTCAPTDVVARGALMLSLRGPIGTEPVSVYGLLPDGSTGPRLSASGSREALSVSDGVFGTRDETPNAVSFTNSKRENDTVNVP